MNKELGLKIIAAIEAEPENFFMGSWSRRTPCGTQCCIAGYACTLSGHPFLFENEGMPESSIVLVKENDTSTRRRARTVAAELLGLTFYESETLFFKVNWPTEYQDMGSVKGAIALIKDIIERGHQALEEPINYDE